MSRFGAAIAIMTLAAPAWGADQGIVEATGEALIKNGDEVAAKKAATLDALRRAIEKVVGIYVESDFSATQREVVRNNQSDFSSRVQDKLVQKAKGFIKTYEVLKSGKDRNRYLVTLRAHVFESKVKAELKSLADLLAKAGNPKLMVIIQEVLVDRAGDSRVSTDRPMAAMLERELLAMGFELKGKQEVVGVTAGSLADFDEWRGNRAAIARMARDRGADIVVDGRVEFRDLGKMTREQAAGIDSLVGMHRIEVAGTVRGINVATGDLFSTKSIKRTEMGTSFDRAIHRILKGSKKSRMNIVLKTFDVLLADAKKSFEKTAARGQAYEIRLKNARSFRKQVSPFLALLQGIEGVSKVEQKSFGKGLLVVDLLCKCSTSELQNRIFSACEAKGSLREIDLEAVSGKQLSFKL